MKNGSTETRQLLSEAERVQLKKTLSEGIVENWVEFWTWQSKVIEKKWQEMNQSVQRRLHV
jgi:predicted flavoprotein YhiN